MTGPVPSLTEEIRDELTRVVRRWHQLPLDRARSHVPTMLAMIQRLADQVADATGLDLQPVPDLGPAVLPDQLRVMVFDYLQSPGDPAALLAELTTLRRSLP